MTNKKIVITQDNLPIIVAFLSKKIKAIPDIEASVRMSKSHRPYIFVKTKTRKYVVLYYFTYKNYKIYDLQDNTFCNFKSAKEMYNYFLLDQWFESEGE